MKPDAFSKKAVIDALYRALDDVGATPTDIAPNVAQFAGGVLAVADELGLKDDLCCRFQTVAERWASLEAKQREAKARRYAPSR